MIRVRYLRTFDETFEALSSKDQRRVEAGVKRLLDYFNGAERPLGLGLRKLKGNYWEIRAGVDQRVFFSLAGDLATLILIGSHDEIRRALRR